MSKIPAGYKQTEVGVIPEEWVSSSVQKIASSERNSIVGGPFGSDLVSTDYVQTGTPVIRGTNMSRKTVDGEFVYVSPAKAKLLEANLAHPNDLVFTQRGTVGQISVVPPGTYEAYLISQSQMKLTLNGEVGDTQFYFYLFSGEEQQSQIKNETIQTGVPHINLSILRNLVVPIPPLPEQKRIAQVLGDVDALIQKLENLIAKKRDLKQAAMQQLLTGKRRLPGFSGPWETKKLGEIGSFTKGAGIRKDEVGSGSIPCIRYGEIYTHHHDVVRQFNSFISEQVAKSAYRLQGDSVLFAGSGETKEEIGKAVAFVHTTVAYAGGDIIVFKPNESCSALTLGYLLNTPACVKQKASRGQGDAVVHISARALSLIRLSLPEKKEQTAIAQVLSDMDSELIRLETRLGKTRDLKAGLMQQLLTGKIRLEAAP
jgi:type I restriction enzyme S subunit